MIIYFRRGNRFKRTAHWLMLLFVLSWMNLVFQAPAHAAMKLDRMLADQAGMMQCHCPPPICDTVLSYADDRSVDGVQYINPALLAFHGVSIGMIDSASLVRSKYPGFSYSDLQFRQNGPPPLLLKTVLLI